MEKLLYTKITFNRLKRTFLFKKMLSKTFVKYFTCSMYVKKLYTDIILFISGRKYI